MATNQEKLDRVHLLVDRYVNLPTSHIADKVLDAPVNLEGDFEGKTNLRTKIAWLAHNFKDIVDLLRVVLANQGRIETKLDNLTLTLTATTETKEQP